MLPRKWYLILMLACLSLGCGSGKERNKYQFQDRPTYSSEKNK